MFDVVYRCDMCERRTDQPALGYFARVANLLQCAPRSWTQKLCEVTLRVMTYVAGKRHLACCLHGQYASWDHTLCFCACCAVCRTALCYTYTLGGPESMVTTFVCLSVRVSNPPSPSRKFSLKRRILKLVVRSNCKMAVVQNRTPRSAFQHSCHVLKKGRVRPSILYVLTLRRMRVFSNMVWRSQEQNVLEFL